MLAQLIGGFLAIVIAVTLLPTIVDLTQQAATNSSISSSPGASVLLNTVPLFFGIAVLGIAIAVIAGAFRSAGLMGGEEDYSSTDEDDEEEPKTPRKQTYLDYVKERIAAQKLIRGS